MLENKVHKALGDISDVHLESAMSAYKRRKRQRNGWIRTTAIAAVLAILLTALSFWPIKKDSNGNGIVAVPGVLRVYACELEEAKGSSLEAFELTDAVDSYNRVWVPFASLSTVSYGIPLTLQLDSGFYEDAEISFHLSVDFGEFFNVVDIDEMSKQIIVKNGQTAIWRGQEWYYASDLIDTSGKYFGYILIYADETLIGYGVIDFLYQWKEGYLPSFSAVNFTTFCFPMIQDAYQNVSETYVWEQIALYKASKMEVD